MEEWPKLMSRIRMYVFIRNESDATLTFSGDEIVSGDYTPDWRPPSVINPGERKGFQGEGDLTLVATTGTEGRVRYNIAAPDGGELYIHWNSPLIESQYANTFHIWAPPGWEVTHGGGQGHHAHLEIRLRRTARRSVPRVHPGRALVRFRQQRLARQLAGHGPGITTEQLVRRTTRRL